MKAEEIGRIAVVGAGLMGHGIAQEFALAGYDVHLNDLNEEKLRQAADTVRDNLEMLVGMGLISRNQADSAPSRLHTTTALSEAVREADVVIEAVFEDLALKQRIFAELDRACPERTILASNTSTFMPSKLASATRRPDRVLVTHYFNPPHLLPLVEVVPGKETSDETVTAITDLLAKVGKRPALVRKEVPGFIGNRLQAALIREALSLVEQGIASPQDVDTVVKNGFGRRLSCAGPFEIFDIAGWDLVEAVVSQLFPEIDSSPEVPRWLREKVERDPIGRPGPRGATGRIGVTSDDAKTVTANRSKRPSASGPNAPLATRDTTASRSAPQVDPVDRTDPGSSCPPL